MNDAEIERLTSRCHELEKQLDRVNAAFEEFVSISAHNARESLREVSAYAQLAVESNASRLDPESSAFLEHVQHGAAAIEALIADVVDYWAMGTGRRQFVRTDMEAVLTQTLLCTAKQIAELGAVVTHDPLPEVTGDFAALAKVLYHLVRNALAYSGAQPPRVHISSRSEGDELVFSVHDNGAGIDPKFQGRLFGPFKRLHGKEYPGNGLGLAFCKRAMEWLGGRIWLESSPGAGSTFYFTLPAD